MLRRIQLVALVAAVAVAALLPLYGDPRNSAVTHAEWARMLLRGLDMQEAIQQTTTATQAFAILSWKGSMSFRADRYVSGEDVRVEGEGERRQVVATGEIGEVAYALAVVRGGDYRLRFQLAGNPQRPVSAEVSRVGEVKAVDAFTVTPAVAMTWMDAGATHLDPGAYTASVLLPRGTTLEHVEVAPPCVMPIEPPGGWKAPAVLLSEHAAVTMVQALDKESELPPSDAPIELEASQFHTEFGASPVAASGTIPGSIKGGPGGTRAVDHRGPAGSRASTRSPRSGSRARVRAGRPTPASSPSCARTRTRDPTSRSGVPSSPRSSRPGATPSPSSSRRARSSSACAPSARRTAPRTTWRPCAASASTSVPPGPMPRNRAVDAMHFLEKKAASMKESLCGDVVLPTIVPVTRAGLEVAQIPGPQQPPGFAGPGQPPFGSGPLVPVGGPPVGPPVGQPSPVVSPAPIPSPSVPVASARPRPRPQPHRARWLRRRRCRRPRRCTSPPPATPVLPVPSPSP